MKPTYLFHSFLVFVFIIVIIIIAVDLFDSY